MTAANWDLFRLFSVVARVGSVNRAAQELGMSQPTLSRRLKELERYINAPLFFRASSGVKLTQEGEDLQRSAAELMQAFETFQRDLRSRVGERSSVVRISATEGLTKHWLLPRVKKLRDSKTRAYLEIIATVEQQSLAKSDLDFVIRMGDPGDNELIGKKVATVPFGIFASADYLAQQGAPLSPAELRDHDIIGYPSDFVGLRSARTGQGSVFEYFSAAANVRSAVRLMPVANHFAAASAGLGLALLAVPFALAEGLVQVLPAETATTNVWLLRRRESDLRRLTREVRRFLEEEFEASRDWFAGEVASAERVVPLKAIPRSPRRRFRA